MINDLSVSVSGRPHRCPRHVTVFVVVINLASQCGCWLLLLVVDLVVWVTHVFLLLLAMVGGWFWMAMCVGVVGGCTTKTNEKKGNR